mmetsp:Transcript_38448/g.118715  ORF Transcript_38448/g.118715 Transcript_38448/m.118715 type:complete len:336 (-) Transcript_38448:37-1044(-)
MATAVAKVGDFWGHNWRTLRGPSDSQEVLFQSSVHVGELLLQFLVLPPELFVGIAEVPHVLGVVAGLHDATAKQLEFVIFHWPALLLHAKDEGEAHALTVLVSMAPVAMHVLDPAAEGGYLRGHGRDDAVDGLGALECDDCEAVHGRVGDVHGEARGQAGSRHLQLSRLMRIYEEEVQEAQGAAAHHADGTAEEPHAFHGQAAPLLGGELRWRQAELSSRRLDEAAERDARKVTADLAAGGCSQRAEAESHAKRQVDGITSMEHDCVVHEAKTDQGHHALHEVSAHLGRSRLLRRIRHLHSRRCSSASGMQDNRPMPWHGRRKHSATFHPCYHGH